MNLVLGIESSCDDTGVSVLTSRGQVLSNVISSQVRTHAPHGGVVPELASRKHLDNISTVVDRALADAGLGLSDMGAVAVTNGPGLLGSVLVGLSFAKALAYGLDLPLFAVNHIEAHILSPWLEHPDTPYPALSLVVSGGHSHLFFCSSPEEKTLVGATRDDAAGEALDKIAKYLGLPYPGGPEIDRISGKGDDRAVPFTLPRMTGDSLDYSFSGLKTAVLHHLRETGLEPELPADPDGLPQWEYDLVASFQKRVVDHLIQRVKGAVLRYKPRSLTLAGGVACNTLLRRRITGVAEEYGLDHAIPSPVYCTDNAAMVAHAALRNIREGKVSDAAVDAFPTALWKHSRSGVQLLGKRHK